eukprot:332986-Pelagomonas_calceolata.AAC.7
MHACSYTCLFGHCDRTGGEPSTCQETGAMQKTLVHLQRLQIRAITAAPMCARGCTSRPINGVL